MRQDGYARSRIERSADLRYAGQSHELTAPLRSTSLAAIRGALAKSHTARFGYAYPDRPLEVVVARVKAIAPGASYAGSIATASQGDVAGEQRATVVWERPRRTRVLDRAGLKRSIAGPAILTQLDSTILVPPGWRARPQDSGNLIIRREA